MKARPRKRALAAAIFCTSILAACTPTASQFMPRYAEGTSPRGFIVCHGYGCRLESNIALSSEEWLAVRARFAPAASDAATERAQIAAAVALVEGQVGLRIGTSAHQRRDLLNRDDTQMDCIDQTSNSWAYLTMMEEDGLLRYHRVGEPAYRGGLLTFDLSNTAVIIEAASGKRFAIDATMVDAGKPPPVEPIEQWMAETEPVWSVQPYRE